MRKLGLLGIFLLVPSFALADLCQPGTLADYIDLGSTGCQIGDKVFSDFGNTPAGPGGVASVDISVTPLDNPLNPGLIFTGAFVAFAGETSDNLIEYTVTVLPGGALIEDARLGIVGGDQGAALGTISELLCLGDTLLDCTNGTLNNDLISVNQRAALRPYLFRSGLVG